MRIDSDLFVEFNDIRLGEVFWDYSNDYDDYFMKMDTIDTDKGNIINCVSLSTGCYTYFDLSDHVMPVSAKLVVREEER